MVTTLISVCKHTIAICIVFLYSLLVFQCLQSNVRIINGINV